MTSQPPTCEQYTAMQFKLERELSVWKADCKKWKYAAQKLQDQSSRITWLENRIVELEKQIENV